jgi:hypothetical protein
MLLVLVLEIVVILVRRKNTCLVLVQIVFIINNNVVMVAVPGLAAVASFQEVLDLVLQVEMMMEMCNAMEYIFLNTF